MNRRTSDVCSRCSLNAIVLIIGLSVFGVVFGPLTLAKGQTATPVPATPGLSAAPVSATPAADGSEDGTFAAFGYEDVTAQGMHANASFFFPLPVWTVPTEGSALEIIYSHSPLLVPDLSTMTVIVNDQSMSSVRLAQESQQRGRLSVPLPTTIFTGNTLSVQIAFYMRLAKDQCEDPGNPGLWTTVHKESTASFVSPASTTAPVPVTTGPVTAPHVLNDLPGLFLPNAAEEVPAPEIVMSEEPTPEEIDAAGIVAFHYGQWAGQTKKDPTLARLNAEAPNPDAPAILVGQGGTLPLGDGWGPIRWDGDRFILNGVPVPPEHGILAMRQQPVPHLLISGATPAAVRQAANALGQPLNDALFSSSAVVITGDLPPVNPDRYAWNQGAASFAQLGVDRRQVTGPGEHIVDLEFERPAAWVLEEGGTLQLLLDVSPVVQFDTSYVQVVVNGLEVGSQQLRRAQAGVERYVFGLPAGPLNNQLDGQPVRRLSLQLRVFLDYPDQQCESIDPESTWAAVLPTSAWILPHRSYDGLDIGRFPAEFVEPTSETPVGIVVPDDWSSAEVVSALQVAAAIGRWSSFIGTIPPQVQTARHLTEEERDAQALILIGGPDRNQVAATLPEVDLASLSPAAYAEAPSGASGILRISTSPWAEDQPVLFVAGSENDSQAVLVAANALASPSTLQEMQGTGIVVPTLLPPQVTMGADPANSAPTELAPYVIPEEKPWIERIPAWQIVGAILFVTLLVLVIGFVLLRWVRGGAR